MFYFFLGDFFGEGFKRDADMKAFVAGEFDADICYVVVLQGFDEEVGC